MRVRPWLALFGASLLWLLVPSSSHAEQRSPFRAWLEGGASFDRAEHVLGNRAGYALAGGIELGRRFGLVLSAGYEHYGGTVDPYLANTGQSGPIPPTVRIEGDVPKSVVTGSLGLRYAVPVGPVDGFVVGSLGGATVIRRAVRWVDPSTGAVVAGGDTRQSSVPLVELGAGLRTRRGTHLDWTLGVRLRSWSQVMEAGEEGSSVQVSIGVTTP